MADQLRQWRRSSRCESHHCVEVVVLTDRVLARDSSAPDGPVLQFSAEGWRAFCGALQEGRLRA